MSFEIKKKPQAERDIEECFVYIGEDRFLIAVEESIDEIGRNPLIGTTREFKNLLHLNLRMLLVKSFSNYQIYYTVGSETVEIIRVLHEARDLENIFG
jgi:toxin ParE1/3/4